MSRLNKYKNAEIIYKQLFSVHALAYKNGFLIQKRIAPRDFL